MFWWREASSHGWGEGGGIVPGFRDIMEDVGNMVCIISEGGADVLVLAIITKPPSLFGLRAPRNQV